MGIYLALKFDLMFLILHMGLLTLLSDNISCPQTFAFPCTVTHKQCTLRSKHRSGPLLPILRDGWVRAYISRVFSLENGTEQEDSSYFIESDTNIFEHILRYLCTGVLSVSTIGWRSRLPTVPGSTRGIEVFRHRPAAKVVVRAKIS